jgi:hypothetical protein
MVYRFLIGAVTLVFLSGVANADIVLEIGPSTSARRTTDSVIVMVQKRWENHWVASLGYQSEQSLDLCGQPECLLNAPEQFMVGVERLFPWKRLSFGLGAYYMRRLNRISSSYINARLSAEFAITDRIAIKYAHISNANTAKEVTLCNEIACHTGSFNFGTDALMLVIKF